MICMIRGCEQGLASGLDDLWPAVWCLCCVVVFVILWLLLHFLRIFMLQIGKRKSIEYIINIVGTFMSKEIIMFK